MSNIKIRGVTGYAYNIYKINSKNGDLKLIGKRHIHWTDSGATYIKRKNGLYIPANKLSKNGKMIYVIK